MRNSRFDTGFITGFDPNRKLLIKSSSGKYAARAQALLWVRDWEICSCLATFAHAQMNVYTSSAESTLLLRA